MAPYMSVVVVKISRKQKKICTNKKLDRITMLTVMDNVNYMSLMRRECVASVQKKVQMKKISNNVGKLS